MRAGWVALAAASLALGGCLGPSGSGVQEIDPADVPYGLLDPAPETLSAEGTGEADVPDTQVQTPVFLLDEDGVLVAAPVSVSPGSTGFLVRQVLGRLEDGPSERQLADNLASAIGPGLSLRPGAIEGGVVEVDVSATTVLPAPDQVPFAIGQIVLSLTAIEGVDAVRLVSGGQSLALPLPGGAQTTQPVTAEDYVPLTVP